jgi:hypothetical protein
MSGSRLYKCWLGLLAGFHEHIAAEEILHELSRLIRQDRAHFSEPEDGLPAAHQLTLLRRLEAAKAAKDVARLRDAERAERARQVKDELNQRKRGLASAYKQLRVSKGRPIGLFVQGGRCPHGASS